MREFKQTGTKGNRKPDDADGRPADEGRQGGGTARRMQAARERHRRDGEGDADADGQDGVGDEIGRRDTDQGRDRCCRR